MQSPRTASLPRLVILCLGWSASLAFGSACDTALLGDASGSGSASGTSLGELAGAAACPEFGAGNALGAKYSGKAELDAQIGAFVQAGSDLRMVAKRSDDKIADACLAIGRDIGVPAERMNPVDGSRAKGACGSVSAKIDQILAGGAKVRVVAEPPVCTADASFQAKCDGKCGAKVDPGKIVASCEPARLSGRCEGTCRGQCEGTCNGTCSGKCSKKDAQGRCVGRCEGTCEGSCSATCHARCDGEWKAPHCEADARAPKAQVDCQANCKASADMRASCSKPRIDVEASGNAKEVAALAASLRTNLPALVQTQMHLSQQVKGNVDALVRSGNALRGQLQGAGGKASACVAAAAAGIVEASGSVSVSVSVSAKVSASAGTR